MPRANWHLADVPVDTSDPFAAPVRPPAAERVDLSDRGRLHEHLIELMLREGELQDRGVTCPLKERKDSCCSACPLFGTHRSQSISALCNVGREQERTTMAMLARGDG